MLVATFIASISSSVAAIGGVISYRRMLRSESAYLKREMIRQRRRGAEQ